MGDKVFGLVGLPVAEIYRGMPLDPYTLHSATYRLSASKMQIM